MQDDVPGFFFPLLQVVGNVDIEGRMSGGGGRGLEFNPSKKGLWRNASRTDTWDANFPYAFWIPSSPVTRSSSQPPAGGRADATTRVNCFQRRDGAYLVSAPENEWLWSCLSITKVEFRSDLYCPTMPSMTCRFETHWPCCVETRSWSRLHQAVGHYWVPGCFVSFLQWRGETDSGGSECSEGSGGSEPRLSVMALWRNTAVDDTEDGTLLCASKDPPTPSTCPFLQPLGDARADATEKLNSFQSINRFFCACCCNCHCPFCSITEVVADYMYWYSATTDSLCLVGRYFFRKSRLECGQTYSTGTYKSIRAHRRRNHQLKVYNDLNDGRPSSSTFSSNRNSRLALALLIEGAGDVLFNCRRQGREDGGDDDDDDDEADAGNVLFYYGGDLSFSFVSLFPVHSHGSCPAGALEACLVRGHQQFSSFAVGGSATYPSDLRLCRSFVQVLFRTYGRYRGDSARIFPGNLSGNFDGIGGRAGFFGKK